MLFRCGSRAGGQDGAGEVAQDAQAVAGGERQKIGDSEHEIAEGELGAEARDEEEWDDQEKIHEGTGGGDQDFVAAAGGEGSFDVGSAQFQSNLAHRHFESCGCEDVSGLVEEQAGKKESGFRDAKAPSAHANAEDDAYEDQEPACSMHAERDHKSRHRGHLLNSS